MQTFLNQYRKNSDHTGIIRKIQFLSSFNNKKVLVNSDFVSVIEYQPSRHLPAQS